MKNNLIFSFLFIIYFSLLINHCQSQWVAQTLPVNPEIIYCMKFWNQNTGWMSTGNLQTTYIPKILKTTNGGDNWFIIKDSLRMFQFQVFDSMTLYGVVRNVPGTGAIYKTFNGGNSWDSVGYTTNGGYACLYFFDKDSGYVGAYDGTWAYVLKTNNGGNTFNLIYTGDSHFAETLIFFKEKVNGEYYGYSSSTVGTMYKTTNSGYNWMLLSNGFNQNVFGYYFLNKDTGWVGCHDNFSNYLIQHTTNGGLNWVNQTSSLFNNYHPYTPYFISYNKGWVGSEVNKIYVTTNGGQVWGRQLTPSYATVRLFVLDSIYAWTGIGGEPFISHTTNGGGVIIDIKKDLNENSIPKKFKLKQNYPNPFNSRSIIEYSISRKATIGINIYDITGRSVYDMTANNLEPGNYKLRLDFSSLNLPSGIYFYKFLAVDEKLTQLFSQTKKLIYIK
jgi:photosystem II stability/assembly factor-like uncharacterized protein